MSEIFGVDDLLTKLGEDRRYHEFLRVPAMSAGLYVLPPEASDGQKPHREDEIYYVVRGKAKMRLGKDERSIESGHVIFVQRDLEHRFFEIAEELVLLVVFAPAETR
ncbi:MAG TPA: cupin domain-containing protein [Terriglobales bacterium]|nr:cupin domain-containing protein [Terriglobales bacterium]